MYSNRIGIAHNGSPLNISAEGIILEDKFGGPFIMVDNVIGNCNIGILTRDLFDSPGIEIRSNLIGIDEANNVQSNNAAGIVIHSGEDAIIGGTSPDDRNVITGNTGIGIKLESSSFQCSIESNFIGTDISGLGNAAFSLSNGIWVDSSTNNFIGHELAEPNIIVNTSNNGIWMVASNNNRVINNRIGADKDGNPFGNNYGITLLNCSDIQIGDINPNQGNLIAHSTNNGISIEQGGQNVITRDSIFANGSNAIEMYNSTTDNDVFVNWIYGNGGYSVITGSQYDIEVPTIVAATQCGANISVVTDLANSSGDIRFEYYTIPNGLEHPSGFGQGNYPELLVGPINITGPTHSQLDVFPSIHGAGDYVSCFISSFNGTYYNTSEFSNHMQIAGPVTANISGTDDVTCYGDFDGTVYFNFTGGTGPYSIEIINSLNVQEASQNQSTAGSYTFTNMYPETYRVIVEDQTGCRDTSNSFTVGEPAPFNISNPFVTDETCPGAADGTIDISLAFGGTGSLQFSIDGGISYQASGVFNSLAPGTYTPALMDANGCDSVFTGMSLIVNPGADATDPTITCPGNQNVSLDATCSFTLPDYTGMATANDNCGSVTVTQAPAAGTVISTTTTITLTADDGNGNTANCTFNVIPVDNTNPTITCPGNQNVSYDALCQYMLLDYTAMATASDNCGTPTVTQSPAAGTAITATQTITLTATDGSGNTANCTFDVIPADNTNPTITCPGNQNGFVDGTCTYLLPDFTTLAVASDNCGSTTVSQSPVAGTSLGLGTHTITLTALDGNGNTANCNFDVAVSDTVAPTISCPGAQSGNLDASCEFVLPDYTSLVSASDNCGVPTVSQSPTPGTIFNGESTQTITMTATYGGLSSNCSFSLIISDVTPPSITCPGNQTEPKDANCQFILPNYSSLAVTSDNCGVDTVTQSPVPGTIINNTTTITLTVNDDNGLTNSCTFDVIPTDQTTPTAICQNIAVVLDNTGNATILASDLDNGSSDNCTPAGSLIFSASQTNFSCADLNMGNMGTVSVDLTVEDATGNQSQCTATVTVDGSAVSTIDAGNDQTLCQDLSAFIGNSYTGPNSSVNWTTTNGTGSFVPSTTVSSEYFPGNGEVGVVELILTASGSCPTVTDTVELTYLEAPGISVSGTDENCNSSDGTITITGTGASGSYEYSYDNGVTWVPNNTETGLSAGTYDVLVRDATSSCSSGDQITINNIDGVQWDETIVTDISCNGANDGSFEGTTLNPLYNHNYILNPAGISQPNDSLFTNLAAGSYEAIVISANGCSDTASFIINEPAPIVLNLSVTDFCLPQVGEIVASATGGSAPYEYSDDGVNFSTNNTFSDLIPGSYTIYVQGANGCTNNSITTVGGTLLLPPTINSGGNYCEGLVFNASGSSTIGADSLIWFNDINPLDTIMGSNVSLWNYIGTQDSVFLSYFENGCLSLPAGIEVQVENNTLDAGPDLIVCPGDSAQLSAIHGTGAFKWVSNEVGDPFNPNASILLQNDGYAIASLQTTNCYFTDSAFVDVDDSNPDCGLNVSNAFSPNGDGINDTWFIQAVEDHAENTVIIVNRWGDEIIRIENYNNNSNAWDGLLQNGSAATEGTYFYIIELKDIDQQINGWIQITN
jgi:gliding motility-associated-like protein